jgi:transaldolase
MKFFVDTADVAEILDGVTTNPSLVAKSGRSLFEVIEKICALVDGPVSAEVTATTYDRMLAEGVGSPSSRPTCASSCRSSGTG